MKLHSSDQDNFTSERLALIALAIILFFFEFVGAFSLVKSQLELGLEPVRASATRFAQALSTPANALFAGYDKTLYIQQLEKKYAQVVASLVELETLREENAQLRSMLENADRSGEQLVIATPILSLSKPAIAAGSAEGVEQGSVVLIDGSLIGLVTVVNTHQSEVTLLDSSQSQAIIVRTINTDVQGIVKGDGRQVIFTQVPQDAEVSAEEQLVTVGQQGIAPGILVGTVGQLLSKPQAAVQTFQVRQLASFYTASLVEVL